MGTKICSLFLALSLSGHAFGTVSGIESPTNLNRTASNFYSKSTDVLNTGQQNNFQDAFREIIQFLQSMNSTISDQSRRISSLETFLRSNVENHEGKIRELESRLANLQARSDTSTIETVTRAEGLPDYVNSTIMAQVTESAAVIASENSTGNQETLLLPAKEEDTTVEGKMIRSPHALLYTGENLTGHFETYDFNAYKKGCYNLQKYEGKIKSVDTGGSCVRIFSGSGCRIWSQAIYPGSEVKVDPKLRGVLSIGPCVRNEFEHVTVREPLDSLHNATVQKIENKVKTYANVPDLIPDYFTYSGTTAVYFNSIPVYSYRLGHENRIEALAGSFHSHHMRSPEEAEASRRAGEKQTFYQEITFNPETDEFGYAFPLELGGPADKRYNVFGQNRLEAGKYRDDIVPQIKGFLLNNPSHYVRLTVNFFYENATSTRPSGMWYLMYKDGLSEITYGYVPN